MKTLIIKKKQSKTWSIHDIALETRDREIKFPSGHTFAVVGPAAYCGDNYTTHQTKYAAIRQHSFLFENHCSSTVIDIDGNRIGGL